jgi:selenide, water dikinase
MADIAPRLTSLAHGGGCGCKLAPSVLQTMLGGLNLAGNFPDLLVGAETSDDAAVWRLNDEQALVATTDFFTPIVDDPFDFGRIAAANALSDVYAMGGRPIMALALVGMPLGKLPVETMRRIIEGGASVCAQVGVPVAGGHSIDNAEPIYGLVALGLVHPRRVRRNCDARPGDVLVLGKRLGVGVYSSALKKEILPDDCYAEMLASCTQVNTVGADLSALPGVHAITDVTGFGLLGHAWEVARGSGLRLDIHSRNLRFLPRVPELAAAGCITGASGRNWGSYGEAVRMAPDLPPLTRDLLCDPQTNGGLLVACAPDALDEALATMREAGFVHAHVVGEAVEGEAGIAVD